MPTLRSSGEAASEAAAPTAAYGWSAAAAASSVIVTAAPTRTPSPFASMPPSPASRRSTSSRRLADSAVDLPREVGAAAHRRGAVLAEKLERLVERGRTRVAAHASASSTRAGVSGTARRTASGRVRERVRDRRGGRDDRRLAEPLRAEVRQVLVRSVDEVDDDLGRVGDRRHLVVVEVPVDGCAGRRVDVQLLGERIPDALDHAALDLARGRQRVDDPADVVHRDDTFHPDDARPRIDRDAGRSGSRTC